MTRYLTFLIDKKEVGILYSDEYVLEKTLINKVFIDDAGEEYILYKSKRVCVYDTSEILFDEPLKKFDGLVFVYKDDDIIAFKTEGFFKESDSVRLEIKPEDFLIEISV